jgi:hypothetical protein
MFYRPGGSLKRSLHSGMWGPDGKRLKRTTELHSQRIHEDGQQCGKTAASERLHSTHVEEAHHASLHLGKGRTGADLRNAAPLTAHWRQGPQAWRANAPSSPSETPPRTAVEIAWSYHRRMAEYYGLQTFPGC